MMFYQLRGFLFARQCTQYFKQSSLIVLLLTSLISNIPQGRVMAFTTPIGPGVAGQVHAVRFHPLNPDVVYAGGDVCGVYKSTDGGLHWEPFSRGLEDDHSGMSMYVDDILILTNHVGVDDSKLGIYAATRGGIYFMPEGSMGEWLLKTNHADYSSLTTNNLSAQPIPFSCLAYDKVNQMIYAGAGSARWVGVDNKITNFYPTAFVGSFKSGPAKAYSIWTLDVNSFSSVWTAEDSASPDKGNVRDIAITYSAVGDSSYIAIACDGGLYLHRPNINNWEDLAAIEYRKSTGNPIDWSGNYWGVAFGNNLSLYLLSRRDSSGIKKSSLMYIEDVSLNLQWSNLLHNVGVTEPVGGVFQDLLDTTSFDLTRLTVVPRAAYDEIYVGERTGWSDTVPLISGLYQFRVCGPDSMWRHVFNITGSINQYSLNYMDFSSCDASLIAFTPTQVGWNNNQWIPPNVPLEVYAGDTKIMIAWMYGKAFKSDDAGKTWTNMYTEQSGDGWKSTGINLMQVNDLAMTDSGRLIVGSGDYGSFLSVNQSNDAYINLDRHDSVDSLRDNDIVYDVEYYRGRIFATIGKANNVDRPFYVKPILYDSIPDPTTDPTKSLYTEIAIGVMASHYNSIGSTVAYFASSIAGANESQSHS